MLSLNQTLNRIFALCFMIVCGLQSIVCHSTVIIHKETAKPMSTAFAPPPPDKRNKQANTLFGIYALSDIEEASCENFPGEVKMVTTIPDSIIHFFAGPVYTTKTVEVYCPYGTNHSKKGKDKESENKQNEVKTTPKENQDGKDATKPNSAPTPDPTSGSKDKDKSGPTNSAPKKNVFDSEF
ncbi:LIC_10461 domain-containing protein [Leptospira barantonii]|uniref:LIC_10461 domain-containing protein n=1 Tax=Leptospira barantonii TaxID=2023184 RepID=UPI0026D4F31E